MGLCPSGVLSYSGLLSQWDFVPVGLCPVCFCPSGLMS